MKKFFAFFVALLLISTCSKEAYAEEGRYESAGDLYQAWCDDMPDYICGVWSTDGGMTCLTFAVQNTEEGNAGKQEILDLINNDSTVTFVYQKYSRNYLMQVQDELYEYFQKDLGLISSGLNEMENRVDIGIYYKRKDDAATKEMLAEIVSKYGDVIAVEYTDLIYTTDDPLADVPGVLYQDKYIFPIALGILILTAALGFVARRKSMSVLATNTGETVSDARNLTVKEVEALVRESSMPLPVHMDAKVMEKIGIINK